MPCFCKRGTVARSEPGFSFGEEDLRGRPQGVWERNLPPDLGEFSKILINFWKKNAKSHYLTYFIEKIKLRQFFAREAEKRKLFGSFWEIFPNFWWKFNKNGFFAIFRNRLAKNGNNHFYATIFSNSKRNSPGVPLATPLIAGCSGPAAPGASKNFQFYAKFLSKNRTFMKMSQSLQNLYTAFKRFPRFCQSQIENYKAHADSRADPAKILWFKKQLAKTS